MIRSYMIGILALGSLLIGSQPAARHRIVTSAQNFEQYFMDLKAGSSLNPVERFVFSLVLANTNPAQSR